MSVSARLALVAAVATVAFLTTDVDGFRIGGCSFNINSGVLPTPEPLFLQPDGPLDIRGYLQPDGFGNISLSTGDQILIACPGNKVASFDSEVIAECKTGTTFVLNNLDYDLSQLACSDNVRHTAFYTDDTCGQHDRGSVANIGHETLRGFVQLIEVCFRKLTLEALFSTTIVTGNIGGSRTGVDRPSFIPGTGFYGSVDPNSHYVRGGQQAAFATLLGSQDLAFQYIANSTDYYLARGHLVAKADFVWAQPQRATFYYINAAPQWQTFNGGNWERLESSVRKLAATRQRDLLVITGAWDRAILPNAANKDTPLFINAYGFIPVPALYWKVVYDNSTGEGVAFVGVNNPYTTLEKDPRLTLCTDVCSSLDWVSWEPASVVAGEGYCCEVDKLRAAIPDVPQLKVNSLLAKASQAATIGNLNHLVTLLIPTTLAFRNR